MIVRGVDVSSYQGTIDWSKVAPAGYGFALARMSIGRTTRDVVGRQNLKAMLGRMPVAGAYGVCGYAEPVEDGAKLLIDEIAAVTDPAVVLVMLDAEDFDDGSHPTIDQVDRYAVELHGLLGRWPVAYVPGWWLGKHGYSVAGRALANCPWAPSHYLSSPWTTQMLLTAKPAGLMGFRSLAWLQYTSSATVPGVNGRCDANVFYGSMDQLKVRLLQEEDMGLTVDDKQWFTDLLRIGFAGGKDRTVRGWAQQLDKVADMVPPLLDDEATLTALATQMLSALQADPSDRIDEDALGQRIAEILHTLGLPVTIADADIQRNLTAVLERAHLEVPATS